MMRAVLVALMLWAGAGLAQAEETPLHSLLTADETRGWEAVGRINLGDSGFCTGALIAPDLVLTAAHCLFDQQSFQPYPVNTIEFLAGWRNGRAAAYRGVRRAMAHPSYTYDGTDKMGRVAYDIALLQLDQPIRLSSIKPFDVAADPQEGDKVSVVSYALDRSEAPSMQDICHVLGRQPGFMVLTCNVDFGSSGAPVFVMHDGVPQIASVISAKAEMDARPVSLASAMEVPLTELRQAFGAADATTPGVRRIGSGALVSGMSAATGAAMSAGGAKFVRP